MRLREARKRLPLVASLPTPKTRRFLPVATGEIPKPRLAVWELTLACDHRCLHCGPRAGEARPDELTTEECMQLATELAELGVGEVVLIGGEAYLRNDFILIIRKIRELGMSCTMTTGGLGLTKTRTEAMVEAGIRQVSVSIDGLEQSHDRVRDRPGSWRAAFAALGHVRDAGAKIAANTQINQYSRHELLPLLELLAEAGIVGWQVQITIPHGNAADHPELLLQPYMLLELFPELERLSDRCLELGVKIWPGNNLGYFGPYDYKLRRHQNGYGHYRGCSAGKTSIGIESNGMIKSCPSLGGATNIGGSWREHGLRALWERAPEIGYARHRTLDDLWGYCRECYYAQECMAGCTATSEPLLGRPGNNPMCHHRALEMDRMGMRERIEMVAAAPGHGFDNGLFQLVREPTDPAKRAREGAVTIERPRVDRVVEPRGPGRPVGVLDAPPIPCEADIAATVVTQRGDR